MLEETNRSVLDYLRDRTTSPLLGAFLISWAIWNYKCVLALLSYIPLEEKIAFIEGTLYTEWLLNVIYLFLGPLTTSVLFLFLYPYPAAKVFEFWRKKQKELRDIKQQIEEESLLTLEESKRIRRQVIEIQSDYEEQLRKNQQEIENLKEALTESQEDMEKAYEEMNSVKSAVFTGNADVAPASQAEVMNAIMGVPYRLVFNPAKGKAGSKLMLFGPEGKIIEGSNSNESSWRVTDGKLELLQSDGLVHSRFNFDRPTKIFTHTNDNDTRSTRGQYLTPDHDAA